MKEMRKARVEHVLWGTGRVVRKTDNVITVHFAEQGDKAFLYPDAFDKYLTMCDAEQQQVISLDLARRKAEMEVRLAEKVRARAEAERQKVEQKALQDDEKRKEKSAARKKTTKTAK